MSDSNTSDSIDRLATQPDLDGLVDSTKLQGLFEKAAYLPTKEILTLVKLAIKLGKPILVEGPPGTGKTALGLAIAQILATDIYRIQCYEGISSEQVIGEFNYQRQLLAIESSKHQKNQLTDVFTPDFFIFRPLLQALQSEKPVVLLIDEIDRSDEEFEAFLLEALGENQVTVPELGTIHAKSQPVVILTSNNSRELSGALRRRSLYLALDYPSVAREAEILKLHVPDLDEHLTEKIADLLRKIRRNENISQPPSISEGIELAKTIAMLGAEYLEIPLLNELLGILAKSGSDSIELRKQLMDQSTNRSIEPSKSAI
ncbi:MAG: MoxR family ATPase [Candidatus Heimdallarchaeota archaeon]|nr:MoxR family ATPase [Candidatus Heimdallarchaeota archaeon]